MTEGLNDHFNFHLNLTFFITSIEKKRIFVQIVHINL